jgi:predicted ester cyclase
MTGPKRTLTLELDSQAEPISGEIREGQGRSRPFVGWLALAGALRRALGDSSVQITNRTQREGRREGGKTMLSKTEANLREATMSDQNKRLVRQVYEDIRSEGNVELVDELFSPDYIGRDPTAQPEEVRGREGFKEQTLGYCSVFPDLRFAIDAMAAEGDEVFVRWTARGTHRGSMAGESPTGNEIEVTGFGSWRIEARQVAEHWGVFDVMGLLRAIGALAE